MNVTVEISGLSPVVNVEVGLTDDATDEHHESFSLSLSLVSTELAGRVFLQPSVAMVTIQDDDGT